MVGSLLEKDSGGARGVKDRIIEDAQAAGHSGTQIRLGFRDTGCVENFDAHVSGAVIFLFAMNFGHFLFISGEPECAAGVVFDIGGELRLQLLPERARKMGEGELGVGIVHDDNVTHACGGRATGDWPAIEDEDLQASAGAFSGAGGADDSSADDDEVEGLRHDGKCLRANVLRRPQA